MTSDPGLDLLGRPLGRVGEQPSGPAVHPGAIARTALDAAAAGQAEVCLLDAIARLIRYDHAGLDSALVAAVACLRLLPDHAGLRAALPLARALDIVAHATLQRQERGAGPAQDALSLPALQATLLAVGGAAAAAPQVAASATERAIRAAARGGCSVAELTDVVVDLLYLNAGICAHLAPLVLATLEVVRVADQAVSVDLLARMARTLVLRSLAPDGPRAELTAPIVAVAGRLHEAEDAAKASAFQEARFRPHLLAGKPAVLVRAIGKALSFGIPRARIARSLCLASAERLLRFDPTIARSPRRKETWLDLGWLLQISESIRALGALHDRPGWIGLLLHGALWNQAAGALDASEPAPRPEPETLARTWDHGPEIARVTGAMLRGDGQRAMAVLRGYLMMVLPEQPLSAAMAAAALEDRAATAAEQGVLLASVVAALAGFGAAADNPHRDLLPCAALHLWAAPQPARAVFALVHAGVDLAEGATASHPESPLPWLAT